MARDLTKFDDNTLELLDSISGSSILLTYRTPTTSDRVRYQSRRFRKEGDKLINCSRKAAIEAAAGVLAGIRDGDFTCGRGPDNNPIPLSSDPTSPHYREDWKELIVDMAGDLLFILGNNLFEGQIDPKKLAALQIVDEDETRDEEDGGIIPPLAKSSGD